MRRDQCESIALKWAGNIREAEKFALDEALPDLDRESLPAVKLQLLLREYLIANAEQYICPAEGLDREEAEEVKYALQPFLTEELIPALMAYEEQVETGEFLLRCIEGQGTFLSLFSEALPDYEPEDMTKRHKTSWALRHRAGEKMNGFIPPRTIVNDPEPPRRGVYPEGYPYMDEFEYIDHSIAGDEDDD